MDIGSGIGLGLSSVSIAAVIIKWISLPRNNGNGNGKGVCPAHADLVSGLTAFRAEVRDQFDSLTKEIINLSKEIKR